jgi:carboxymethylenebutenolidase
MFKNQKSEPTSAALDRRSFVGSTIAAGFAAAVAPTGALWAQVVKTDSAGLTAGTVQISRADGSLLSAYRAAPAGRSNLPTILVAHEIWGVHEYIQDVCRRFAQLGYLAIAPELFARQGDPRAYATNAEIIANVVSKVADRGVMEDFDACVDWAATQGGDRQKLGITGFCRGGRYVWLYASYGSPQSQRLKAAVSWYGQLSDPPTPITPTNPLAVAQHIHAPVLGLYGALDQGIPLATVESMKSLLKSGNESSQASQIVVYPDAGHAFHADYRPSYQAQAAEDGWRRALDWFARHDVR